MRGDRPFEIWELHGGPDRLDPLVTSLHQECFGHGNPGPALHLHVDFRRRSPRPDAWP